MFLTGRSWYTQSGEQRASGRFLMLFSRTKNLKLKALVRRVEMHQTGHFMMGRIKLPSDAAKAKNDTVPEFSKRQYPSYYKVADGHYCLHLSGTYGDDGLPMDADAYPGLWEQLHEVPEEIEALFWVGGGHNSAGKEAGPVSEWAKKNINKLTKLKEKG